MQILRRPVEPADHPFLLELYASVREAEMSMVPWNEEQKSAFVESQFLAQIRGYAGMYPKAIHEILIVDEQPVGRLYVSPEEKRQHILDVTIHPRFRNRSIGTHVLGEILEGSDKPVTIYVESFNPSMRLFARLGFRIASQDGFLVLLERSVTAGSGLPDAGRQQAAAED